MFKFWILFFLLLWVNPLGAVTWESFKQSYIQPDGRVRDPQNGEMTHTEGVGYAMFFAVSFNDQATFERLDRWLEDNIPKNDRGLYPWKWGKDAQGHWGVLDTNNATDGDMWIAYARIKAAQKFHLPQQQTKALAQLDALEKEVMIKREGKLFLLPGAEGFVHPSTLTLNPSYSIPFMLETFGRLTSHPQWGELLSNAQELMKQRFSVYGIHPDWISYHQGVYSLLPENPSFSYDALRIPLFWTIWYRSHPDAPQSLDGYARLKRLGYFPRSIDLLHNSASLYEDHSDALCRSLAFFSTLTIKDCHDTNLTYFSDALALFATLPPHCYDDTPIR
jgi:endoglucanase